EHFSNDLNDDNKTHNTSSKRCLIMVYDDAVDGASASEKNQDNDDNEHTLMQQLVVWWLLHLERICSQYQRVMIISHTHGSDDDRVSLISRVLSGLWLSARVEFPQTRLK